ncbi:BA75_04233T0 [Komagataella pastoris]|uniref:Palmitoyltransferase n=1 Tax=Komagataella pastoris TaxID=4922 RepID=A0A1B2JGK2_PICPA|nr:BA75_04233T0 [Komagataella pastoris]
MRPNLSWIIPILVLLGLGYLEYIYAYRFCYIGLIRSRSQTAVAIVFIALFNILYCLILFTWFLLVCLGPGRLKGIPLYNLGGKFKEGFLPPPDFFVCNGDGLPEYCTTCHTVKYDRSHHSSKMERCVPVFDHYCLWVGVVIGKNNYKNFMLFMTYLFILFIYVLITFTIYAPSLRTYRTATGQTVLNPNFIVMYICTAFWIVMLLGLLISHLNLIASNRATIDDLKNRRPQRERVANNNSWSTLCNKPPTQTIIGGHVAGYVSVKHPMLRDTRVVFPYYHSDKIYDHGWKENMKAIFGDRYYQWVLPQIHSYRPQDQDNRRILESEDKLICCRFKEELIKRIHNEEGDLFITK